MEGAAQVATRELEDLLYLLGCGLTGQVPSVPRVQNLAGMGSVLALARRHSVAALAACALAKAGALPPEWQQAISDAEYRCLMMGYEREQVLSSLAARGIRMVPLKGIVLSALYPEPQMREMCDNDILYDFSPKNQRIVAETMHRLGFEAKGIGVGNTDDYMKEPICNFEMHTSLFVAADSPRGAAYFDDIWERVEPDERREGIFRMEDCDFYLYVVAHAFKHYKCGGMGLRTLCDAFVLRKLRAGLDQKRLETGLEAIGAASFERALSGLAEALLAEPERSGEALEELPADQAQLLSYMVRSGTYGLESQMMENRMELFGEEPGPAFRLRYILRRCFPTPQHVLAVYPLARRIPPLLPFVYIFRFVRGLAVKHAAIVFELRLLAGKRTGNLGLLDKQADGAAAEGGC